MTKSLFFSPKVKNENIQLLLLCPEYETQLDESFIPLKGYMNEKGEFKKKRERKKKRVYLEWRKFRAVTAKWTWVSGKESRTQPTQWEHKYLNIENINTRDSGLRKKKFSLSLGFQNNGTHRITILSCPLCDS